MTAEKSFGGMRNGTRKVGGRTDYEENWIFLIAVLEIPIRGKIQFS